MKRFQVGETTVRHDGAWHGPGSILETVMPQDEATLVELGCVDYDKTVAAQKKAEAKARKKAEEDAAAAEAKKKATAGGSKKNAPATKPGESAQPAE